MTGALLALLSAAVWGAGDFTGGLATRRSDQYQVLALAAFAGIVMLVAVAVFWREPLPDTATVAWASGAGVSGAIGIACLYRGLAEGRAAVVAPTAAVITAAVPVLFTAATVGLPRATQVAGFALAMLGIWLVGRAPSDRPAGASDLKLAVSAGLGFGGFLTLIAQVDPALVFMPLAITRAVTFLTALVLLFARRAPLPSLSSNPFAWVAGLLDASGNVFYLLARQFTRLDVAAVLSSFYPATTVLLAWIISRERVTPAQWCGAAVCLAAVALITL
jgi:drug/metabolite transporter (DMT)-like permease